jgi:predicted RNA-binding Zn-ribbon protein involved in translation (DUF1610 family)
MSSYVYLLILVAIVALFIILRMPKRQTAPLTFPYHAKKFLLSSAERSFLGVLDQVLANGNCRVFAQVRLADIVEVDKGLHRSAWQQAFNIISRKHVDFVVCQSDDMAILGAIELDDGSHQKVRRKDRDVVLGKIFAAASIPLLRVQAASSYAPNEIKSLLGNEMHLSIRDEVIAQCQEPKTVSDNGDQSSRNAANTSSETEPAAETTCPKCGSPLIPRVAKKGKHQGQKFWGCSNFPDCKYISKRE